MGTSPTSRRRFLKGALTAGVAATGLVGSTHAKRASDRKTLRVRASPGDGRGTYRIGATGTMYEGEDVEGNDLVDGGEIEGHLSPGSVDVYEYTGRIEKGFFEGVGGMEIETVEPESAYDATGTLAVRGYGISGVSEYEFTASYGVYESEGGSLESNDRIVTTDSAEGVIGGKEDRWRTAGELTRFGVQLRSRPVYFEHRE